MKKVKEKVKLKAPGLRIIKTIIAIVIVLIISKFSNGLLTAYDMVVVAILAMQGDVAQSLKEVRNRISSTVIGGIIGTIVMSIMYISGSDFLDLILIPLGVFLILYFCSKLIDKSEFIIIACYVFLAITLDEPAEISWLYPIRIMANTIVSSIVAMAVNLYTPKDKSMVKVVKEK